MEKKIGSFQNIYQPLRHKETLAEYCTTILGMEEYIFDEQYDLGIGYLFLLSEMPSTDESKWLTCEKVYDMLHITHTTLWRKENEGVIKKHKMVRRNLYSKKEVTDIFSSAINDSGNKCKEECHG